MSGFDSHGTRWNDRSEATRWIAVTSDHSSPERKGAATARAIATRSVPGFRWDLRKDGLQRALGGRYRARRTRIRCHRHAQCAGEGLEHRFRLMMRVVAAQVVEVHRDQRVVDETLEEFVREVDVEGADQRPREWHVELEPGTAGKVDHRARQRFVEAHVRMSVAREPGLVAERLPQGLAAGDADVLDRVVRVDM